VTLGRAATNWSLAAGRAAAEAVARQGNRDVPTDHEIEPVTTL
jgi:hypothetical protein